MNQQPLVSVIIPTYSRPDNIVRAVDSVLTQTYKNIEVIVVDDNGEGTPYQIETEKVLKEYIDNGKITYIKHEVNKNGSAARNTGFRASHGEYVNFLDDDDYLKENCIEVKLKKLIGSKKNVGACITPVCYIVNEDGKKIEKPYCWYRNDVTLKDFLIGKARFNTSGILFKRYAIEIINGFDETFKRHQDFELLIRFFELFEMMSASNEALYYMDNTSNGEHTKSIQNRLKFEEDFLVRFKEKLSAQKCYHSVSHFLYWQCCVNYLEYRDYYMFLKSLKSSLKHGLFSVKELKTIIVIFVKDVLNH